MPGHDSLVIEAIVFMEEEMRSLSVLIKPASGLCNMRCRYCFYADVTDHREVKSYGIMSEETAETLIRRSFEYADGAVAFAFQGGEPTLAGEEFFRFFTSKVNELNTKNQPVAYSIQTNGYSLTDEMCEILRANRFLVGISLDGTSAVHDNARLDAAGEGTHKKVSEAIAKLEEYGIDYNILAVVTDYAAKNISKIYNYFRSRNFKFIQFIKHIDGFGDCEENSVYSLTPKRYASFLKTAFGYYYDDFMAGKYISVREFDNFVMLAAGRRAECCGMNGTCALTLVCEADGSAYPCDFYVLDEWRIGNIRDCSVEELFETENARRFLERSLQVNEKCRSCKYFGICRGGCARYREKSGENILGPNKYCESYMDFFDSAMPKIMKMASSLRNRR